MFSVGTWDLVPGRWLGLALPLASSGPMCNLSRLTSSERPIGLENRGRVYAIIGCCPSSRVWTHLRSSCNEVRRVAQ